MTDRPPPPEPSRERTKGWGVLGLFFIGTGFVCYIAFAIGVAVQGFAGETDPNAIPVLWIMVAAMSFLTFIVGVGLLIAKVLVDRVLNREDSYYSKHIER